MDKIQQVLSDFYHCLTIPISFFNEQKKMILNHAMTPNLNKILDSSNLFDDYQSSSSSLIYICRDEKIHFILSPLYQYKQQKGLFIIGPFHSDENLINSNIPFKPHCCLKSIGKLFESIVRHRLFEKHQFHSSVKEGIYFIHKYYEKDIKLDEVCQYLNLNKSYFCSIFKSETGMTFSHFLNRVRIEKSKQYLKDNQYSILEVALAVGFNNHNYYSSTFKKLTGLTPAQYRQKVSNE
ncbi:helix-turn-helix domain-containing protein [Turicibacter sanguinis]|uniref:helix-turn-helix domain-containing protein n=1 Tax=Turicibacter sanguinis TaxID=154288 RepID=UPI00232F00D7|nr:helix-turn-helix domain-containing protein [Turicibacter sanguinis]MDB8541272.1 helix-turn-helix domain-containing protein [Turicibacter sanguinis]